MHVFSDPGQQNYARRVYERLDNLERATNQQSFNEGSKAPAPPTAGLSVTTNPNVPGHVFVRVTNPEFLTSKRNPIAAPIRHWLQASPSAGFNGDVTDFGISHQTYWDISELGSGSFHFQLQSTHDGKTFNTPVRSGQVVIP